MRSAATSLPPWRFALFVKAELRFFGVPARLIDTVEKIGYDWNIGIKIGIEMEWARTLIASSTMENGKLPAYKRVKMAADIEKIGTGLIADLSNERDGVALPTTWNNIIWLKSYMSSPRSAFASIEVSDLDGVTVASVESSCEMGDGEDGTACLVRAIGEAVAELRG